MQSPSAMVSHCTSHMPSASMIRCCLLDRRPLALLLGGPRLGSVPPLLLAAAPRLSIAGVPGLRREDSPLFGLVVAAVL